MRLVLDTNVLVSAILNEGPARRLLRGCIDGRATLLVSPATLEELDEVLHRPKFGLTEEEVYRVLSLVVQTADVVKTTSRVRVVTDDPDDDAFLELAVDGRADLIVSGDKHLVDLAKFRGIPIEKPADVVRRLNL